MDSINLIANEKNGANVFLFEIDDNDLPKLSLKNAYIAESIFMNDSSYHKAFDINSCPNGKKKGSTAFWTNEFKKYLLKKDKSLYKRNDIIENLVSALDRENRTHINADKVGKQQITKRICDIDDDNLLNYLQNPEDNKYKLIDIISEKTNPKKVKGKNYKPRENLSFASKFCHYACYFIFNDKENLMYQDNYSIYDNILKKALPLFIKHYKLKDEYNLDNYIDYQNAIDDLLTKEGNKISRNAFDHIVWLHFKGK